MILAKRADKGRLGLRKASLVVLSLLLALTNTEVALAALEPISQPQDLTENQAQAFGGVARQGVTVWAGLQDPGDTDYDVFARLEDGTVIPLSDNSDNDFSPLTDGDSVAWMSFDGVAVSIWGGPVEGPFRRLDTESVTSRELRMADGIAVWTGFDGTDDEIFAWDSSSDTVTRLTDNDFDDSQPDVSDGLIVWISKETPDGDVVAYERSSETTFAITADSTTDAHPSVGGRWAAWVAGDAGSRTLKVWDGSGIYSPGTAAASRPVLEEGVIAWLGDDGMVWTLRGHPASTPPSLISVTANNSGLSLDRGRLMWLGGDGDESNEVWVSDLFEPTPVPVIAQHTVPIGGTWQDAGRLYWTGALARNHVWTARTLGEIRHWGTNRYRTAAGISQAAFPGGSDTVVIATGEDFPDALAGVPLAHAMEAPILLVGGSGLDATVRREIVRLGAKHLVVLGGAGAVSDALRDQVLAAMGDGSTWERIGGINRYETAQLIAMRLREVRGSDWPSEPRAFIATGENFPDALTGSPIAAAQGWPILLTRQATLSNECRNALSRLGVTKTYLMGGEGAISGAVEDALPDPERFAGTDRYETGRIAAERALARAWLDPYELTFATGELYPDALVGGVLAARAQGPLVLVRSNSVPAPSVRLVRTTSDDCMRLHVLGGPRAIDADVEVNLFGLAGGK
ncbi:MAG: hypothetical protein Kow0056_05800 [Coriobacteriia bacterium]